MIKKKLTSILPLVFETEDFVKNLSKKDESKFSICGFNFINDFFETEKGWINGLDCNCPFCLHYWIKNNGTRLDKIKFNENSKLYGEYIIPLNNKENYIHNRIIKKEKKLNKNKKSKSKLLNIELNEMKKQGFFMLRRGRNNIQKDVFSYITFDDGKMETIKVYVKGLIKQEKIQVVFDSDKQKIDKLIENEILNQKKYL